VIAGRRGDDAARAERGIESRDEGVGAPELECPAALQRLGLEPHRGAAARQRELVRRQEGCTYSHAAEQSSRGANVGKRNEGRSWGHWLHVGTNCRSLACAASDNRPATRDCRQTCSTGSSVPSSSASLTTRATSQTESPSSRATSFTP